MFADGSVSLNLGAADLGTGTKTVMAQVVSEELGIAPDRIQIEYSYTATTQPARKPDRQGQRCSKHPS